MYVFVGEMHYSIKQNEMRISTYILPRTMYTHTQRVKNQNGKKDDQNLSESMAMDAYFNGGK